MLRVKIESNVQEPHIKVSGAGLAVKVEGRKRGKNDHQAVRLEGCGVLSVMGSEWDKELRRTNLS